MCDQRTALPCSLRRAHWLLVSVLVLLCFGCTCTPQQESNLAADASPSADAGWELVDVQEELYRILADSSREAGFQGSNLGKFSDYSASKELCSRISKLARQNETLGEVIRNVARWQDVWEDSDKKSLVRPVVVLHILNEIESVEGFVLREIKQWAWRVCTSALRDSNPYSRLHAYEADIRALRR